MACLRGTDETLEKVQRRLEEQEASRVNDISLLENDLKKMSAEIAELQEEMAHEPVAPRFLPKPRLTSQCDSISRVQDSKGQIFKPTPSAPQGEPTDQKEHFRFMAEPNALQKKDLLFFQLSVM